MSKTSRRVFILGAGFSKPAGMPLATELLPLLEAKLDLDEMREWLAGMRERLEWLGRVSGGTDSFRMTIEEVFHYAHFDIEVFRLRQQLVPVGRGDGPATPWSQSRSISAWLQYLEEQLCDVLLEREDRAKLAPIARWAAHLKSKDVVVTFNYDTLVERVLRRLKKHWTHGLPKERSGGIRVLKLHGSIDWIVAHRNHGNYSKLDLLFDKRNDNQSDGKTGNVEDDFRLWRCRTRAQTRRWLRGRILQLVAKDAAPNSVGIAGLRTYKQLHQIPGLGHVWTKAMTSLFEADSAIVIGFSMSEFDAMAQMQFVEVARARAAKDRPLAVTVIDPYISSSFMNRFRRIFRNVTFINLKHEEIDWSEFKAPVT